jgi:hypothetical protein
MSQQDVNLNDDISSNKSNAAAPEKLEKIIIDSSDKYEAYLRFNHISGKILEELANINTSVNKVNTQLYIIKRRQEIFIAKHKVLSEYGSKVYGQPPTQHYMAQLNVNPTINTEVKKFYFDPVSGYIRNEGDEIYSNPVTPASLKYEEDDDDSLISLHFATEASSLSQSKPKITMSQPAAKKLKSNNMEYGYSNFFLLYFLRT